MKKQFLLLIVILLAGVCFSSHNNSSLKACNKNAAAGSVIKRNNTLNMPVTDIDVDGSFNMFMNPFQQL